MSKNALNYHQTEHSIYRPVFHTNLIRSTSSRALSTGRPLPWGDRWVRASSRPMWLDWHVLGARLCEASVLWPVRSGRQGVLGVRQVLGVCHCFESLRLSLRTSPFSLSLISGSGGCFKVWQKAYELALAGPNNMPYMPLADVDPVLSSSTFAVWLHPLSCCSPYVAPILAMLFLMCFKYPLAIGIRSSSDFESLSLILSSVFCVFLAKVVRRIPPK